MARYNPVIITDEGQEILFKAIAGTYSISFTAMAFGAGEHADSENLAALTELDDERQRVQITGSVITTDSSIVIKAAVNNAALLEGYRIREIGIFCKDGDDAESDEVLYAIVTAAIPAYMPAHEENSSPMEFSYQFGLGVGDASSVTIQAGGNGYYTQAEVDALLANYYTKAQIDAMLAPAQEAEQNEGG